MNIFGFYVPRHYILFAGSALAFGYAALNASLPVQTEEYVPMERLSGNMAIGWYRDRDTGCEYFGYFKGGFVPRMNYDGKQVCNIRKGPDFETHQ